MRKNIVEQGRPQMTIRRVRFACCAPKATNTHTEYAIYIAFPQQQWLRERVSMLRYTYIACLVRPLMPSLTCRVCMLFEDWETYGGKLLWRLLHLHRDGVKRPQQLYTFLKIRFWRGTFRSWRILVALINSMASDVYTRYS